MKKTFIILISYILLSRIIIAASSFDIAMLLLPDGNLEYQSKIAGNIDFSEYSVQLDPILGPVFTHKSSSGWYALGPGLNDDVRAIVMLDNDIYVGGLFTDAGGVENADHIARWDGNNWHALGTGLNHWVSSLGVHNGELYAGGFFKDAGGDENADHIARWDGSSWNALQEGLNWLVLEITVDGDDIYVGGQFSDAGGITDADQIVRWTDNGWHALGESLGLTSTNSSIEEIIIYQGDVYIGGTFEDAWNNPDIDHIAYWNGSVWKPLGSGLNDRVYSMATDGVYLYVGGKFTDAGGNPDADYAVKGEGSGWWDPIGPGLEDIIISISLINNDIYLGGGFTDLGGVTGADGIARWDGSDWHALGAGLGFGFPYTIVYSNEKVYVGGFFSDAGGNPDADMIAFWNPSSSININTKREQISLFPNPTTGVLEISVNGQVDGIITIFDEQGKIIMEKPFSASLKIDLSAQPQGIYLVEIKTEQKKIVRKIVKK